MKKLFWQLFIAHTAVMALTLLLYGAFSAGREVNPVWVVLLAILAGTVTGTFVTFLMRKKLGRISSFARKIASGDFRNRLIADDRDEIAELRESLNAMAEALEQNTASLHDEKAKMETALLGMTDGVLLLNPDGRVVLANASMRIFFDIQGEVKGRPFREVIRNRVLSGIINDAHSKQSPVTGDLEVLFPRARSLAAAALPIIQNSMGEDVFLGTVVTLHDLTRLNALERTRRDFVANVSHELKTPIAAIRGFAETLMDGALDEPETAERFLGIIQNHAARLNRLVDDLMTLSGIELDEVTCTMRPVDIKQLIENTVFLIRSQAKGKNLTVQEEIDTDLPFVDADNDRLTQVLLNLLDNAVKFTPEGGEVRVRARCVEVEKGRRSDGRKDSISSYDPTREPSLHHSIEISVEDTGPGIPSMLIPRLGERFYRVDPARSRELGGTGLGLAIVKHLLNAHGASMDIRNAPQKGTIVSFRLMDSSS